jgi:hypothetical protein
MNALDRLAPHDRRVVLALTEAELAAVRHPEMEEARAHALLERAVLVPYTEGPGGDWWGEALPLLTLALGTSPKLTWTTLLDLLREHGSRIERHTPFVVAQAVLAHLTDWATLDASGRQTAIEKVDLGIWTRDLDALVAAANAHGLPLSAPELHPPLTWPVGRTERFLGLFVAGGQIIDTGERRNFWPVYDLPSQGPPLAQPEGDVQETGTATATPTGGAAQLGDAARTGDLNVTDESSAHTPMAAAAREPTGPSR